MDRDEKIKVAITAGIAGAILLILVLYLGITSITHTPSKEIADNSNSEESAVAAISVESISSTLASEELSISGDDSSESASLSSSNSDDKGILTTDSSQSNTGKLISGNSFYPTSAAELKNVYKKIAYEVEPQLKEMFGYWNDGNLDAVSDLAHLERFEIMSFSLTGTKDFYYFGDKNADGVPEGKGIAVYANDQYYFGEWKSGLRCGQGMWINFYPSYSDNVVIRHQYVGEFNGDLPDGTGQEHIDYEQSRMNSTDLYIQNAIGNFKNGFYDGRMYIITVNSDYQTKEWYGDCDFGNWKQVLYTSPDEKGRIAVLDEKDNAENHIWMTENATKNNGVSGYITGGRMVSK